MYDDLDTNWGELAIKNPIEPGAPQTSDPVGPLHLAATRQRGNSAVTKSRLGLWLLVADHPDD